jgi:hypothetical protein
MCWWRLPARRPQDAQPALCRRSPPPRAIRARLHQRLCPQVKPRPNRLYRRFVGDRRGRASGRGDSPASPPPPPSWDVYRPAMRASMAACVGGSRPAQAPVPASSAPRQPAQPVQLQAASRVAVMTAGSGPGRLRIRWGAGRPPRRSRDGPGLARCKPGRRSIRPA